MSFKIPMKISASTKNGYYLREIGCPDYNNYIIVYQFIQPLNIIKILTCYLLALPSILHLS